MHVVQINFFRDSLGRKPRTLLRDWHSLVAIAEAVATTGARVTVIQASSIADVIDLSGVRYHFLSPDRASEWLTGNVRFRRLLSNLEADAFHVHGLGFPDEVLRLRWIAPTRPILLQDHANGVPRIWSRRKWRRSIAAAGGLSFCAREQAEPFYRRGLVGPETRVFEIPESTSSFRTGDRTAARAATGLYGDPAVLWVGHLNDNKDPLTVLDGISSAAIDLPDLHLWLCYSDAPLLSHVRRKIAEDTVLSGRVHLLGRVAHARVEQLMQAADLFVHGSHREGSSFAVIEALATGLTPVVTDIPSLRSLTRNGNVGVLWPRGEAAGLARAIRQATDALGPESRSLVRLHFDTHLSTMALGAKLIDAYEELETASIGRAYEGSTARKTWGLRRWQ